MRAPTTAALLSTLQLRTDTRKWLKTCCWQAQHRRLLQQQQYLLVAVASWVTADSNISPLHPFIDVFMVATGIEQLSCDAHEIAFFKEAGLPPAVKLIHLYPSATRALADCIHAYSEA